MNVTGPVAYQKIVIDGPSSKVIHLFGDIHRYESECKVQSTTIVDLIHHTLIDTNEPIDLFVEMPHGRYQREHIENELKSDSEHMYLESQGYLNETINFFLSEYNCFMRPVSEYCQKSFPHRFHNVDFRFFPYEQIKYAWTFILGRNLSELVQPLYESLIKEDELQKLIDDKEIEIEFSPKEQEEIKKYGIEDCVLYYIEIQSSIIKKVYELLNTQHKHRMDIELLIWIDYFFERRLSLPNNPYVKYKSLLSIENFGSYLLACLTQYDSSTKRYIENDHQITYRMRRMFEKRGIPIHTHSYVKKRLHHSINSCPPSIQNALRSEVDTFWTRMVAKRNDIKGAVVTMSTVEVVKCLSDLMNLYVVIRLSKDYIKRAICFVGIAHLLPISEMLRNVYKKGFTFNASEWYGDQDSVINDSNKEDIVQCISIPLTKTIPPLLDFSNAIPDIPNNVQEVVPYNNNSWFEFTLKDGVPVKRISDIVHVQPKTDDNSSLEEIFKRYSQELDQSDMKRSFRKLLLILHPDKTIGLGKSEQKQREEDYKRLSNYYTRFKGNRKSKKVMKKGKKSMKIKVGYK